MKPKNLITTLLASGVLLSSPAFALGNKHCDESRATFGGSVRIANDSGRTICGGVLISDRAVLTAASCFQNNHNAIPLKMHVQQQNSRITSCITYQSSTNNCVARLFTVRIHPDFNLGHRDRWGRTIDTADDVAIVYINNNNLRYRNRSIPTSDFARLYAGVWQKTRNQIRTGFGLCRDGGNRGTYREKSVRIEHFHDHHYYHKARRNNYACDFDWGSPAYLREHTQLRPVVVGILGNFENDSYEVTSPAGTPNSESTTRRIRKDCTRIRGKERFAKVSPKVTWISDQLSALSGRGCRRPYQNVDGVDYQLCFD